MAQPALGFSGVGRMGAPMVSRLLAAGYSVTVHDTNAEIVAALVAQGAKSADGPTGLATAADVVFLSLPTPEVVESVAIGPNGIADGGRVRVVIDLSTTGPRVERKVAAGLKEKGKSLVDCPVSGGVAGAEKGTLALMAACDKDVFAEIEPILQHLGKTFYVGAEPGLAQMLKVINNLLSVTALAISSEALVLGAKAGLDPDIMLEAINAGTGRSNATTDKIPKFVLSRSFDFGFGVGLSSKDIRLCLEEGDALGVPMFVGSAVRQLINVTKGRFGPGADLTEIIRPIEEWAGVTVRGKSATGDK